MYISYGAPMSLPTSPPTPRPPAKDSLSVKIGGWFEAHATGAGIREVRIIALPVVLLLILLAIFLRVWAG